MNYYTEGNRVVREDGLVAMQHHTSNPSAVSVEGTNYTFLPKLNVSLAWVHPEHVDKLLAVRGSGNGGCNCRNKQKYLLASLINVNLWEYGDRNGQQ